MEQEPITLEVQKGTIGHSATSPKPEEPQPEPQPEPTEETNDEDYE